MRPRIGRHLACVAALLIAVPLAAQEKAKAVEAAAKKTATASLDTLLSQLRQMPEKAWDERLAKMQAAEAAEQKRAKDLRAQAARLLDEAKACDERAKALVSERAQMTELRKLISGMAFEPPKPAPAKPNPAPAKPKAAPAKPKPAPAKPKPAPAKPKPAPAKPKPAPAKSKPAPAKPKPAPAKPKVMTAEASANGPKAAVPADTKHERLLTYDDDLLPLFEDSCTVCHEPGDRSGGLDLSSYSAAIQGGGSGRTIRPGNPDGSRLWMLVSHQEKPTMPPDEPRLPKDELDTIRLWIAQGAPENKKQAEKLQKGRIAKAAEARAKAAAAAKTGPVELPEVWPAATGVARLYPEMSPPLRTVSASPVAPLLAVSGHGQVLFLRSEDLQEVAVVDFPFGQVHSLSWSADGTKLLAAGGIPGKAGGAQLIDVAKAAELSRFAEQKDVIPSAALSPDGRSVAVGGTRRRVEVFDVESGERLYRVGHDEWVTAVAFDDRGELLASADRSGLVRVTEARTGRDAHELRRHEGIVHAVAFRPGGAYLASAGEDQKVIGWRMSDGRRLWEQRRHSGPVHALDWLDAARFASVGADGQLVLWRSDGNRLTQRGVSKDWAYGVTHDRKRKILACTDWQGALRILPADAKSVAAEVWPLRVDS